MEALLKRIGALRKQLAAASDEKSEMTDVLVQTIPLSHLEATTHLDPNDALNLHKQTEAIAVTRREQVQPIANERENLIPPQQDTSSQLIQSETSLHSPDNLIDYDLFVIDFSTGVISTKDELKGTEKHEISWDQSPSER